MTDKILDTDFNNKTFRQVLASRMGVPEKALVDIVMPQTGEKFMAFGCQWVITYRRERPFRISAEPCGVVKQDEVSIEDQLDMRGVTKKENK